MKIEVLPMGVFAVNCYILECETTGEVVVVDPGDVPGQILRRLEERGVEPVAILNTHGHIDHVAGNTVVKGRYDVPIWMHPADQFLIDGFAEQAALFGLDLEPPPNPDHELVPGEAFRFGDCELDILYTPGHSPGSVTFVHDDQAISGDVLFQGSIGRTDLPQGDIRVLLDSIDRVLVPLGAQVTIHPGHGPKTTIAAELKQNPFLREEVRRQVLRS